MRSPRQRSPETPQDVIPLHPTPRIQRTRLLLQRGAAGETGNENTEKDHADDAQNLRGHFGHDGSEDFAGGVFFAFPGHVFDHGEGGGGEGGG